MKIWGHFSSARSEEGKIKREGTESGQFKSKKQKLNVNNAASNQEQEDNESRGFSSEKVIFRTRLFAPRILSPSVFETLSGQWALVALDPSKEQEIQMHKWL